MVFFGPHPHHPHLLLKSSYTIIHRAGSQLKINDLFIISFICNIVKCNVKYNLADNWSSYHTDSSEQSYWLTYQSYHTDWLIIARLTFVKNSSDRSPHFANYRQMTREMTTVMSVIIWDSRDEECDDGHYDITRILDTITRNVEDKSNYDTMRQCSFAGPDSTRPTLMPCQELSWHVSRPVKSYDNMVGSVKICPVMPRSVTWY